jgi:hypothetical protein
MPSSNSASTRLGGLLVAVAALAAGCTASGAEEKPATPAGEDRVAIVRPGHGGEVTTPASFTIDRGSVQVTPDTADEGGRFWLVVDAGCYEVGETLEVDEPGHIPVPDDQDTFTVDLAPGAHDVCLQFADAQNVAYYEVDEITISVVG